MNKKIAGAIVAVTVVGVIVAGGVFMYNQNNIVDTPPSSVQQEVELPEEDNKQVDKIQIDEEDGSVTAIVDGEAFAGESSTPEEEAQTPDESTYDLGKEMGLSDEAINSVLEEDKADTSKEETSKPTQTPPTSKPETVTPPPSSTKPSTDGDNTAPSDKTDENGNKVWQGEDPFKDVNNNTGETEIIDGDGTVPEGDKGIKFN